MRVTSPVKLLSLLLAVAAMSLGSLRAQSVASALYNFETEVRNYNLVALSSTATTTFSSYGDTEGGIAVNGNLSISGGSIDDQVSTTPNPSLFVSGTLTLNGNTQLNAAYASVSSSNNSALYTWCPSTDTLTANNNSGSLNITNSGSTTDPIGAAAPTNWNWSTETSDLTADSTALANATANGTTVVAGTISVNSQNLTFTPDTTPATDSTVIFTLNAADLSGNSYNGSSFSNISISVPNDVNYVIDVVNASGTTLFSGANFNSGTNDDQVLWNIEGTGTVALGSGSFYGAVLAPTATVTNNANTIVTGQIAAANFSDTNTELHYANFDAVMVVIPEPMTFALWGVGLCALAIVARRKLVG